MPVSPVVRAGIGVALSGFCAFAVVAQKAPGPQDALDKEFSTRVRPILLRHCAPCHGGKKPVAGLALDQPWTAARVVKDHGRWERLAFNVRAKTMPPQGSGPTDGERATVVDWVERALSSDCDLADAGKVTIRRLNRSEYNNTVRDLLGVDLDLSAGFPSDDVGEGFDNIGDVLSLSPLYVEKWLTAAETAARAAVRVPQGRVFEVDLSRAQLTEGQHFDGEGRLVMFTNAEASSPVKLDQAGAYIVRIEACGTQAGPDLPKMRVRWGPKVLDTIPVAATPDKPTTYEVPLDVTEPVRDPVKEGAVLSVAFVNDFYDPGNPDPHRRDRNLLLLGLQVVRPATPVPLPNGPITAQPKDENDLQTPRLQLERLASRAYRRPVNSEELDRLMALYQESRKRGESFEEAFRDCVTAVLCSPHFLFRVEADRSGSRDRALNDFELAARLSYFLWGSMPDETLSQAAARGVLHSPDELSRQTTRMLQMAKSRWLSTDFALQWLQLRKLETSSPDPRLFPEFDDGLRKDMLTEATTFFADVLFSDRSVLSFLDSDHAFVNDRLAKLYGIEGVSGPVFRSVALKDKARGGLLGMAAFLTVTSNPNRTSPVKRGRWILEQVLGTPPPPPPPAVGVLPEDQAAKPTMSMKERLALHRQKPECATCHKPMDALGFALENFDPIGRWRTKDGDFAVDPTGELPDGTKLGGPTDVKKMLVARKRDFVKSLAAKMLTYATGRPMRPQDQCHVDTIVKEAESKGYRFQALVQAVVHSDPFTKMGPGG